MIYIIMVTKTAELIKAVYLSDGLLARELSNKAGIEIIQIPRYILSLQGLISKRKGENGRFIYYMTPGSKNHAKKYLIRHFGENFDEE